MRLILSVLIMAGLAVPATAEDGGWISIAIGHWIDGDTKHVSSAVRGYFPTSEEAEEAALASCREDAYNCEVFFTWNQGCFFTVTKFVPHSEQAQTYLGSTPDDAYDACVADGGEGCHSVEVIGGCPLGHEMDGELND